MRSLIRGSLFFSLAAIVALAAAGQLAMAGDGPWSVEIRATQIVPMDDEGTLDVAGFGNAGEHAIDLQDAVAPEIALGARVSDHLSLEVSLLVSTLDAELDIERAGTIELGDTDLTMLQIAGLYDVAQWGETRFRLGWVFGLASFDDADLNNAARGESIDSVSLSGDLLYGLNARVDTPIGASGWYFSSNLKWYFGGEGDVTVSGTPAVPEIGTPEPLAPTPGTVVLGSGDLEFDPLMVSLGLGYRY